MLEVMCAVMILVIMVLGVYQFVRSNLKAISESERSTREDIATERFFAYVQEQINSISPRTYESLLSESLKLNGVWLDSLVWKSRAGLGLLTRAAPGEYRVKLRIQPVEKNSNDYEIGLWRRPITLENASASIAGGSDKDATWVPLLRNVSALRFEFFDIRINQWVGEWKDPDARPTLIKVHLWQKDAKFPMSSVFMVPASQTQR